MNRIRLAFAPALLLALLAACSDITTPNLGAPATSANVTTVDLAEYIDQQIALLYDKGFATSVQARWNTIKKKKPTNFAVATKDFAALADWIDKKVTSIRPPEGESQLEASVRLALNMSHWLYGTGDTPVETSVGQDVALEVVPAGQPATVVVPSEHAGVDFGPQNEDRVIIISQEEFPGHCNGPLVTARCQYPLFYRFDSFPHEKLAGRGRFAVCLVTTGDRRPLDYTGDDEVHHRIRLAHERPADPANYSEGGTVEGEIEMLQRATDQKGITRCDQESHLGMGPMEKTLHNVMHFAGRILSPKDAHAYDQGPEHFAEFFSHFNGVDAGSQPDVSVVSVSAPESGFAGDQVAVTYTVENRSRRSGGHATAMSDAAFGQLKLFNEAGEAVATLSGQDAILPMRPDDPAQTFTKTVTLPSTIPLDASYHVGAVVGDAGTFGEVNLANNTGKAAAATLVKQKRADLQVASGFTLTPMEVMQGGSITASSWTVLNSGNAASGNFDGQFYLVSASGARTPLGAAVPHASLDAGTSAAHAAQTLAIANSVAPGTYGVELVLDDPNAVQEFDETNNRFSVAGLVVKSPGPPSTYKVLVLSNSSGDNNTIISALTPRMPGVSFTSRTSASGLTPDFLAQFRTILLSENGIWSEATVVGNAIAAYVQSGGNLVLSTFYWQDRKDNPNYGSWNTGWGQLETLDPLHAPPGMDASSFWTKYEYRSAQLDPLSVVTHPLTAGVNSVNIMCYPNGMEAKPGTSVVARFTNGAPYISYLVHALGQRVVALVAFPGEAQFCPSSVAGDFYRAFVNALNWSAGGSTPAAISSFIANSVAGDAATTPAVDQPVYGGTSRLLPPSAAQMQQSGSKSRGDAPGARPKGARQP